MSRSSFLQFFVVDPQQNVRGRGGVQVVCGMAVIQLDGGISGVFCRLALRVFRYLGILR